MIIYTIIFLIGFLFGFSITQKKKSNPEAIVWGILAGIAFVILFKAIIALIYFIMIILAIIIVYSLYRMATE